MQTFPLFEEEILFKKLGDIILRVPPIETTTLVKEAFLLFMEEESLNTLPVVDSKGRITGRLQRKRFLEKVVLGKYGYGIHLYGNKKVAEFMENPGLILFPHTTLEEAAMSLKHREKLNSPEEIYDDLIVVDEKNNYLGLVPVHILVEALAKKSLLLARDCNPLTGLPGNWAFKKYVEEKISINVPFETIYIDINNFKPFNDKYGFVKGDEVIISLGEIIKRATQGLNHVFVAHIGGDDFIVVCDPRNSENICKTIKEEFEKLLPLFHGEDYRNSFYISRDREGKTQKFPLLSLTFALVGNKHRKISSYAHLASIAAEVKGKAKMLAKTYKTSVIYRDQRKDEGNLYIETIKTREDLFTAKMDIFFQPILDLSLKKVIGFEALVRGFTEEGKSLSPYQLFEKAKELGVLKDFDRLCREKAMKKIKDYGLEKDFLLFLNVHNEAIDQGLVGSEWILKKALYYGLKPDHVVIEVCENRVTNFEGLVQFIKSYKGYGFLIALDDFGVKHSNIERLLFLEPNFVKIARVLLDSVDKILTKRKLLEGIYTFLEKLEIPGILEGLETHREFEVLRNIGFRYAQGFLFSPPVPDPLEALVQVERILDHIDLLKEANPLF